LKSVEKEYLHDTVSMVKLKDTGHVAFNSNWSEIRHDF